LPQRGSPSPSPGQRPAKENATLSFQPKEPTVLLNTRRYFDQMGQSLIGRLIDTAHEESTNPQSKTEKHPPIASMESRTVRNLALQSIAGEMQHHFANDQDDFEPLFGKHLRKHETLALKAADEFHSRLIACD
jgi:hypothetical protein